MLCVPKPGAEWSQLELRPLREDEWLCGPAHALFPGEIDVRVPYARDGRSMHAVFTEAHDALFNGREWTTTQLKVVLREIINGCKAIAVWWGDDWSELPIMSDEDALEIEVKNQLRDTVGDVYLRWQMKIAIDGT